MSLQCLLYAPTLLKLLWSCNRKWLLPWVKSNGLQPQWIVGMHVESQFIGVTAHSINPESLEIRCTCLQKIKGLSYFWGTGQCYEWYPLRVWNQDLQTYAWIVFGFLVVVHPQVGHSTWENGGFAEISSLTDGHYAAATPAVYSFPLVRCRVLLQLDALCWPTLSRTAFLLD